MSISSSDDRMGILSETRDPTARADMPRASRVRSIGVRRQRGALGSTLWWTLSLPLLSLLPLWLSSSLSESYSFEPLRERERPDRLTLRLGLPEEESSSSLFFLLATAPALLRDVKAMIIYVCICVGTTWK